MNHACRVAPISSLFFIQFAQSNNSVIMVIIRPTDGGRSGRVCGGTAPLASVVLLSSSALLSVGMLAWTRWRVRQHTHIQVRGHQQLADAATTTEDMNILCSDTKASTPLSPAPTMEDDGGEVATQRTIKDNTNIFSPREQERHKTMDQSACPGKGSDARRGRRARPSSGPAGWKKYS